MPSNKTSDRQRAQRLSNRGADYLRSGEVHNALSTLRRAYEALPDDVPTAINLGGAYIMLKQFAKAIPILEKALEQEPENEMIWINLGAAYLGNPVLARRIGAALDGAFVGHAPRALQEELLALPAT